MGYREEFYNLIEQLKGLTLDYYSERLITLAIFGSVARDTFRPDSDIDILIIAEGLPKGRLKRVSEFEKNIELSLEETLKRLFNQGIYPRLSPLFKTPEEVLQGSPIFLDMTEDVKILYDRDNFFKTYLQGLKERLKRLGARKVYFKGGYYWELKPDYKYGEIIEL
ncbi:MAG: nucleotidyltransferase family protein [Thermodesulfovibrionales bacterium]